jgi:ABC-2 type transport system ATP-binding protein
MERSTAPVITTKGLTKYYGSQCGIADLDLEVSAGEVFGFLGANGAGKTTTIRLLLGLIRPTRGSAMIAGLDLVSRGVDIRALVGYLPGDLALYERMTGEALLGFLARIRGGVDAADYRGLAERLGLELNRRIGDLSKGNRQKVGVVQALMHHPRVLVLDEPTSGLDPLVQAEFSEIVREAVARGATVFLSSHVLAEVERIADRVAIVAEGRLLLVDTVDALRERATKRVELDFPGAPPPELATAPGVRGVEVHGATALCTVAGPVGGLVKVASAHDVVDVHTHDPDLEDAFLDLVTGGGSTHVR